MLPNPSRRASRVGCLLAVLALVSIAPDWWTGVRARTEDAAYAVRPGAGPAPAAFEADNPAQRWQARFTSEGVAITPAAPVAEGWTVGLRLAAYGAADALTPVQAEAPQASGARVEFRYGETEGGAPALTEWYVNEARGLEHGFTLAEAPAGAGPVTLELTVSGGLRPFLELDGRAVELRAPNGAARVRYADLSVTDAGGRTLPSHLAVPTGEPARMQVVVDTRGAIYPVTIDPLLAEPPTTLTGPSGSSFGSSVATAGDVNGDGYADVVVGAPYYSSSTGRAYVYQGGPAGLATTAATTLTGWAANDVFGRSVATAGDVNGDGYADVVIGAYQRACVYLGGPGGLGVAGATTLYALTAATFGSSVATAGDVNGDGYSDVLVGEVDIVINQRVGKGYVYLGGPGGVATAPSTILSGGCTVATAGDVNGDGYADVATGCNQNRMYMFPGEAYLYLGGASGLATTPTILHPIYTATLGEPAATAGDVNGDGYADLLVWSVDSAYVHRVFVYLGRATGLDTTPAQILTDSAGISIAYTAATAGDVNGDGYADVVVGGADKAYVYQGRSWTPTRVIGLSGDLAFGSVTQGSTATRTLTISNTENSPLSVTAIWLPTGFSGGWSGTIEAGQSKNVTITFAPTAGGDYGGTVTVRANETSGTPTIPISGTGTPAMPAPTLVFPTGSIIVTTAQPTYQWSAVPGAAEYYLHVWSGGQERVGQWFTANAAGCGGGAGTCSVTPATALPNGIVGWEVKGWNATLGHGALSADGWFTVAASTPLALTAPALVYPAGSPTVTTAQPTYQWGAVAGAEEYYLWVSSGGQQRIGQWVTAAAAGCGGGTGTCSLTPAVALAAGTVRWEVKAWSQALGHGPWSADGWFTVM